MKICTKCKIEKQLFAFHNDKNRVDGLYPQCKQCVKIATKKYYIDNKDIIKAKTKEYYKTNTDSIKEKTKIYCAKNKIKLANEKKKYYKTNKKILNANSRIYYNNNKESLAIANKKWAKENPEKKKAISRKYSRKRRAQKLMVNESYTKQDEAITRKVFNNKCVNCGFTEKLCVDHHLPLSRGFPLSIHNAVTLCMPCNSSKGTRLPKYFYSQEKYAEIEFKLVQAYLAKGFS